MPAAGVLVAPVAHDSRIVAVTFVGGGLRSHWFLFIRALSRSRGPVPGLGPGPARAAGKTTVGAISGRRGPPRGPLGGTMRLSANPGCDTWCHGSLRTKAGPTKWAPSPGGHYLFWLPWGPLQLGENAIFASHRVRHRSRGPGGTPSTCGRAHCPGPVWGTGRDSPTTLPSCSGPLTGSHL